MNAYAAMLTVNNGEKECISVVAFMADSIQDAKERALIDVDFCCISWQDTNGNDMPWDNIDMNDIKVSKVKKINLF